jgi:hypothetical protein
LAKKRTWLKTKVRAYLAVSRKADFKQKAMSQQPRCTPTSTCKHSQLAIRTQLAYNGLGKLFSMAVHATRRIRKVSVGLERQADSVAVVELAAVRMSDSDDEVIIASSSKENFGMKYDTNCLPYAPAGRHMAPETEGCLYAYGGGACAPMAMGGIPPESQFSWLSGSYLIMSF